MFLTAQPGSTVTICFLHRRMYLDIKGRDIAACRNRVQLADEMQTDIQMSNPLLNPVSAYQLCWVDSGWISQGIACGCPQ